MRDVIIVAGHTNVQGLDQGAQGNGYSEGQLAVEFRDLLISELKNLNIKVKTDSNRNALAQTLQWLKVNLGSNKTILIDIHWNAAANPEAKGSEVIIPDTGSYFEKSLGKALLKVLTDLGFRDRGVKPEALTARRSLAWMKPNAENILIEMCFISNALDMKLYQANKNTIAKRMALVIQQYVNF